MLLCYALPNGEEKNLELEKQKITIGRGRDVDLIIKDHMASRLHCCVELKDDAWYVRDLNSRNGTFVNGEKIQVARLNVGDHIQIGDTVLACKRSVSKGAETVIRELKDEMDGGKGFKTMLIEIVGDEKKNPKNNTDEIIP